MIPARCSPSVSRTLDGQLGGQLLTAMCVHLDGERRAIRYAGAGHPPLLHWRAAEQTLDVLDSDCLLIKKIPSDTDRELHAFSLGIACSCTPMGCSKPRTRPRHSSATNAFTPRFGNMQRDPALNSVAVQNS